MDGGEGGGISKEEEGRLLRDLVGKGEQLCEAVAVVQSVEPAFLFVRSLWGSIPALVSSFLTDGPM